MRWNIADLYDLAEQHIPHDRVAIYMRNCAGYVETAITGEKARLTVAVDFSRSRANGKADYVRMQEYALKQLGLTA